MTSPELTITLEFILTHKVNVHQYHVKCILKKATLYTHGHFLTP